ncbi:MAG: hypothetical protein WC536_02265 [Patescibacteria group bacterium]
MENKLKDNLGVFAFIILIAAIGLFSTKFVLNNISSSQTSQSSKKEDTGIDKKAFEAIAKPSIYDSNFSLESGFGRENPFAPYK